MRIVVKKENLKRVIFILILLFSQILIASKIYAKGMNTVVAGANVAVTNIENGKVQGFMRNDIYTYLGIPYAKAERFMPPKKLEKWQNTYMAFMYGDISLQSSGNPMRSFLFDGPTLKQSDDAQNLNIWTPAINDGKKRAVMVWLHGGGLSNGSSIESYSYHGENLSKKGDIVVVSVNHRLNAIGFLDLSAYGEEYKYSANLGIMDLVAALEWIKENIENFGGDPNNVTIFGESGGGAKVLTLMATPAAKGLFHKAIVQSGAVERMGMTLTKPESGRRVAELTLEYLGLNKNEVKKLKDIPYEKLLEASNKALADTAKEQNLKAVRGGGIGLAWAPTMDGDYIPVEPVGEKYSIQSKDIPLLIGSNLTEWETIYAGLLNTNDFSKNLYSNKNTWTNEEIEKRINEKYRENAVAIKEAFKKAYPNRNIADVLYVDSFLRTPALKTARLKADQNGAPVYNYIFSWDTPVLDGIPMSYHTAEIAFVMNNVTDYEFATGGQKEAQELADKMSQAWINFAKTGNPNVKGMAKWEAFTRENGAVMIFDNKIEQKYKHDEELMRLLAPNFNF